MSEKKNVAKTEQRTEQKPRKSLIRLMEEGLYESVKEFLTGDGTVLPLSGARPYRASTGDCEIVAPLPLPDLERGILADKLTEHFKELINGKFTVAIAYKESLDRFEQDDSEEFSARLAEMGAYDIDIFGAHNMKHWFGDSIVAEIAKISGLREEIQKRINEAANKDIFPSREFNGVVLRSILRNGILKENAPAIRKLAGADKEEAREKTKEEAREEALREYDREKRTLSALGKVTFNSSYTDAFLIGDLAKLHGHILDYFTARYGASVYDLDALPVTDDEKSPLHTPGLISKMYDNDLFTSFLSEQGRDMLAISGDVFAIARDIGMIQEVADHIAQRGRENSEKYLNGLYKKVSLLVMDKYFSYSEGQALTSADRINELGSDIWTLGERGVVNGYGESAAKQIEDYAVKNLPSLPAVLTDLACDSLKTSSEEEVFKGKYLEELLIRAGTLETVKRELSRKDEREEGSRER